MNIRNRVVASADRVYQERDLLHVTVALVEARETIHARNILPPPDSTLRISS